MPYWIPITLWSCEKMYFCQKGVGPWLNRENETSGLVNFSGAEGLRM